MGFLKKAVRGFGKAIFGGRKSSASPAARGAFAQAVAKAVKAAPEAGATGTSGAAGKASEVAESVAKSAMAAANPGLKTAGLKKGGMVSKRSSGSARGQGAVMKKKRPAKIC